MKRTRHIPEQIIRKLREAEAMQAPGLGWARMRQTSRPEKTRSLGNSDLDGGHPALSPWRGEGDEMAARMWRGAASVKRWSSNWAATSARAAR